MSGWYIQWSLTSSCQSIFKKKTLNVNFPYTLKDIFNRIEEIMDKCDSSKAEKETDAENNSDKNRFKEIIYLVLHVFLNVLKAPFKIVAKYLKDEIIIAVKKDAKIYALILGIMGVLFVFFSVIWLFISVAIGVYFYDQGHSILISIIYSVYLK